MAKLCRDAVDLVALYPVPQKLCFTVLDISQGEPKSRRKCMAMNILVWLDENQQQYIAVMFPRRKIKAQNFTGQAGSAIRILVS